MSDFCRIMQIFVGCSCDLHWTCILSLLVLGSSLDVCWIFDDSCWVFVGCSIHISCISGMDKDKQEIDEAQKAYTNAYRLVSLLKFSKTWAINMLQRISQ